MNTLGKYSIQKFECHESEMCYQRILNIAFLDQTGKSDLNLHYETYMSEYLVKCNGALEIIYRST